MARNLQHVAHNSAGRSARAGALAKEHRLADKIAYRIDGIEDTVHGRERMVDRQHSGMDAHVNALRACGCAVGEQLNAVAHILRSHQIRRGDVANAFGRHVVDGHAGIERNGRQNGDLRGSIQTVDVRRGIGLGKAFLLRLFEARRRSPCRRPPCA